MAPGPQAWAQAQAQVPLGYSTVSPWSVHVGVSRLKEVMAPEVAPVEIQGEDWPGDTLDLSCDVGQSLNIVKN